MYILLKMMSLVYCWCLNEGGFYFCRVCEECENLFFDLLFFLIVLEYEFEIMDSVDGFVFDSLELLMYWFNV